jgi:hypothetical protein
MPKYHTLKNLYKKTKKEKEFIYEKERGKKGNFFIMIIEREKGEKKINFFLIPL